MALNFTGGQHVIFPDTVFPEERTLLWRMKRASNPSIISRIVRCGNRGYIGTEDAQNRLDVRFAYTNAERKTTQMPLPALGEWVSVVIYNPVSRDEPARCWFDGVEQTAIGFTASPVDTVVDTSPLEYTFGNHDALDRGYLGDLAEFAIVSGQLSTEEIAAFTAGYSPILFRRTLFSYLPFVGDANDIARGAPSSIAGSVIVSDHPRTIYGAPAQVLGAGAMLPPPEPPPEPDAGPLLTSVNIAETGTTGAGSRFAVSTLDGVTLGQDGGVGTVFEGYRLWWGESFNAVPPWIAAKKQTGRYGPNRPSRPQRRHHLHHASFAIDDSWHGPDAELAQPFAFNDIMAAAGGSLTITARAPNSSELEVLPATFEGVTGDAQNKPLLLTADLDGWPSFLIAPGQSDYVFFAKMQIDPRNIRGYWPAVWHSTVKNWPDYGEVDLIEGRVISGVHHAQSYLNISTSDGAGNIATQLDSTPAPTGRMFEMAIKKQGNTLTLYNDFAQAGQLAQVATYTDARVGRLRGAHRIRFGLAVSNTWDSSVFNAGDWPAFFKMESLQLWAANSGYSPYESAKFVSAVKLAPGQELNVTLPTKAALYDGKTIVEEVSVITIGDEYLPGLPVANDLANGMAWDEQSRQLSWTADQDRGGRIGFMLAGVVNGQLQAEGRIFWLDVAPAPTANLFGNQTATVGSPFSASLPYIAFHSGNLPHTYTVTHDAGGWLNVSYGSGNESASLTGTPNATGVFNVTINATNSAGQTTTIVRTITVSAS
jgi:hypothetical protein